MRMGKIKHACIGAVKRYGICTPEGPSAEDRAAMLMERAVARPNDA